MGLSDQGSCFSTPNRRASAMPHARLCGRRAAGKLRADTGDCVRQTPRRCVAAAHHPERQL